MVFLFLLILFIILFKTKIKRFYKIILVLLLISSSFFLIKNVPGVKNRFVEIVNSYNKPPVGMSYDSTNIRVAIINCSKQIVEVNFIKGVGFNNIKQTFLECYKTTYDSGFYKNNIYLTHNYFMYILISSGIFGLFVFLFYIYNIIKLTIKINSFLLYVMLFNVLCVSLLEDFFYRQFGLFYFSLIFFCFLNNKRELIFKKESSQTIH
ncbi:O-antigen ligase family protein [Flavobacterium gelidilacus]|uniref:O-antigen ligase family protein n=1 Tax=Flavobacterium gelidilacus TaxID=206041 RepID=UPI0039F008F2